MHSYKIIAFMFFFACTVFANAQNEKVQQGLLLKSGTNIRLGGVQVLNKRSLAEAQSSTFGVFIIPAVAGDTLLFTDDQLQSYNFIVSDLSDKVVYLDPVIRLEEVVVKENSLKRDIKNVQLGYREKSVFYTGTPHYYYLVLKPMTFIYENFKSEVRNARKFNRYACRELASYQITSLFNDSVIKKTVPISDNNLEDFRLTYMPTLKQIKGWDDYDMINYIKGAYAEFKKDQGE